MSTFPEARELFKQAFIDNGLWVAMSTVLPGCTAPTNFYGDFRRPDITIIGAQSAEYEINYVYSDAPTLQEGAEIIVAGILYRLRSDPFIDPLRGADGYWRSAFLTRVGTVTAP